ncbi:hypothetical protein N7488_009975, partial [Penicillium malachiteum]
RSSLRSELCKLISLHLKRPLRNILFMETLKLQECHSFDRILLYTMEDYGLRQSSKHHTRYPLPRHTQLPVKLQLLHSFA